MRADILQYFAGGIREEEGENDIHSEEVLEPFIPEDVGDD